MRYSLGKISTVQACDDLMASVQKKKQNLERRRRNLGESIDTFRARLDAILKESILVQLTLAAFTTAYHALPEGRHKANMNVKVKRQEVRQAMLEKKAYTCNVASLLIKEMRYKRLDSKVSVLEHCIAAVRYRRMTLGRAALRVSQAAATTFSRPQVSCQSAQSKQSRYQAKFSTTLVYSKHKLERNTYRFRAPDRASDLRRRRPVKAGSVSPGVSAPWLLRVQHE